MSNKIKSRVGISTLGIIFMLLMSNLTLVIGVSAAVAIPPPKIISVTHNASSSLTTNDVLTVTLVGDPFSFATFNLGDVAIGIEMYDDGAHNDGLRWDGVYVGNYAIQENDNIGIYIVTGHLKTIESPQSSKDAASDVIINTEQPEIIDIWHNANTTTLKTDEVLTVTLIGDPYFNATFDIGIIAYDQSMNETTPGTYQGNYTVVDGDNGNWTVTGYLKNGSSVSKRNATPNVLIDTPSPNITSVTHDVNKTLTTNDTINVTLEGDPGMTAWFYIEKLRTAQKLTTEKQWLNETDPGISGIYVGNYTIKGGDDGSWTVVGYLQNETAGTNPSRKDAIPDIVIDTIQPGILDVVHTVYNILTTGDSFDVFIYATEESGLIAMFDIGNTTKKIATNVSMEEIEPTGSYPTYKGNYTVKDGDDGNWTVTGYLDDGVTPRASKNATDKVLIDTIRPQIDIIWHNANDSSPENSLDIGDVLNVTLVGEPNLTAAFDLGTTATEQSMNEMAPGTGIYKGNYTVVDGDDGAWTVIGYLNDSATPRSNKNAAFQVIIGDVVPPNPPTGLSINQVPEGDALTLTWDPWDPEKDPDLDHYCIHRSIDGINFNCIDNNVEPFWAAGYTDFGLTDGAMYYYYVTAVDNKSNESPYLYIVGARPQDTKVPDVADLELWIEEVPVGNALFLRWGWEEQTPPDPDVCGYNLYKSMSYDGIYNKINDEIITGMNFTDTNLIDGVEYFYKLTALDEVPNESGYVGPMSGIPQDTTPPNAPKGLSAQVVPTGNTINISWDANQEEDLAGYNIYRSEYYWFGPYALIGRIGTRIWYQDTNLIDGKKYYYIVTAFDEVPNESSNIIDIEDATKAPYVSRVSAFPRDSTAPSAVAGLTVKSHPSGNTLILSWNEEDMDIVNYSIYRSVNGIDFNFLLNVSGENTSYTDTGLVDGILYYYYVIGIDEVLYASTSSAIVGASPQDTIPPAAPIGLTVNSRGVDGELDLIWIPNQDNDIAGYRIYRSISDALYELVAEVSIENTYIDRGLANEITYYYKIAAIDEVPNQSPESKAVSSVPHAIPVPPTGLTVVPIPIGNALNISWNLNVGNIVCYSLYRSIDDMTYELITKTSSNVQNYIDKDLIDGVTYYYKISASIRIDVNLDDIIYSIITESWKSMAVGAIPMDTTPPGAPMGLSAKIKDKYIYLDWRPPDDTDVVSYNIYRSFDVNTTGTLIAKGITERNWVDRDIVVGQRYYYTVTAVDEVLNESPMVAKTSMLLEVSNDEIIGHIALLMIGFLIILIIILGLIIWKSIGHKERLKEEEIIDLEEEIERELEKEAAEDSLDDEIEKIFNEVREKEL